MLDDALPGPIAALKTLVGPDGWSDDADRLAPKLREWRDRWRGATPLLLLPRSTEEVSRIVRHCAEHRIAVTPQGGNTGLVGGQIPVGEVLLSTERLRAIREVAPLDDVMVVEAGVPLATVQEAAREAGRFFPLNLASEGSATVGGLISTNAGGTAVLRYGSMRDLVLGIEAVLPDGSLFSGLKRLRKDNTGYDLKQLLIGGEGTLGVVTAAALKLFPILRSRAVAVVGLASSEAAIHLLARAKDESGGAVEAFELISRRGVELAMKNIPDVRDPLGTAFPWIVLVEIASSEGGHAEAAMERLLAASLEDGLIEDAALAQNQTQAKAFWRLREEQSRRKASRAGGFRRWRAASLSASAIASTRSAVGAATRAAMRVRVSCSAASRAAGSAAWLRARMRSRRRPSTTRYISFSRSSGRLSRSIAAACSAGLALARSTTASLAWRDRAARSLRTRTPSVSSSPRSTITSDTASLRPGRADTARRWAVRACAPRPAGPPRSAGWRW